MSSVQSPRSRVQGSVSNVQRPKSSNQRPASTVEGSVSSVESPESSAQNPASRVQRPNSNVQSPGIPVYWILLSLAPTNATCHLKPVSCLLITLLVHVPLNSCSGDILDANLRPLLKDLMILYLYFKRNNKAF